MRFLWAALAGAVGYFGWLALHELGVKRLDSSFYFLAFLLWVGIVLGAWTVMT